MKRISVFADFDFLSAPLEIGTLGYEHVRGAIKEWRKTATQLRIPLNLLGPYSMRWDTCR